MVGGQNMVQKCPDCGSDKFSKDYTRGEVVCTNCGLIVGECIERTMPEEDLLNKETEVVCPNCKSSEYTPLRLTKSKVIGFVIRANDRLRRCNKCGKRYYTVQERRERLKKTGKD